MVVELFRPLPNDAKVETLIDADSEWWSSHPIDHAFLSFEVQRIKASISVQPRKMIFCFGRRLAMGLILSSRCIGFGSIYPSMFQILVRLNFKVTRTNWHVLQSLLVVAPNLEVLVIDKCTSALDASRVLMEFSSGCW
ncbi:hypothetical protein CFP56_006069 [Quercus suber]|uniref:Uncharacterized protein n=1 Tax=Quercus suber TaxID=58331 RepID=A0AAW0LAE9_QUESU